MGVGGGKREHIASVGGTISSCLHSSAEPLPKKRNLAVACTGKLPVLEHRCFGETGTDKRFPGEQVSGMDQ